jgi:hypothetical protein
MNNIKKIKIAAVCLLGLAPFPLLSQPSSESGKLSLSPSRVSFGTVGTELTGEKTLKIRNSGKGELRVEVLRWGASNREDFSQQNNCGVVLGAGAECSVVLSFSPLTEGVKTTTLEVETNVGSKVVELTGRAQGPKLSMSPRSVKFSSQGVGSTSAVKGITIKNSGKGILRIATITRTGEDAAQFTQSNTCGAAIEPKGSCRIEVAFAPSRGGDIKAALTIASNTSESVIALQGKGFQAESKLALSPAKLSFRNQGTEVESAEKKVTVRNKGTAPLVINLVRRAGEGAGSFSQRNNCGVPIEPKGSCEIWLTFTPTQATTYEAQLQLDTNSGAGGASPVIGLSGNGVGPRVRFSPSMMSFREQPVGLESAAQSVLVRNSGKGVLRVEEISLSGPHAEDFDYRHNCDTAVLPGGECAIEFVFRPLETGSRSAVVTVRSNSLPQVLRITGIAGEPPPTAKLTIDLDEIVVRAGQSVSVPFSALTADGRPIKLPSVSWSSSDRSVVLVSDAGIVSALPYEGFDVKTAIITVTSGSTSATASVRVTPDSDFLGYRVREDARLLGSAYWENTPVPLELVLRVFFTRHKNHPQQYSGWSGALTAGDFNHDGFIDVFTAGSACAGMQSRPTFLIWNPRTWRFDEENLFNDGTDYLGGPMGVAPVYLNDDDYVDLVIIGHSDECARPYLPNEPVRIALSDGRGGYDLHALSLQSEELLERFGQELGDVGDVTGDGLPDLLVSANSHAYIFRGIPQFPYFTGDGFSHFASDTKNFPDAQNGFGERVPNAAEFNFGGKILDFDQDGRNDFIMLTTEDSGTPRQSRIFFNQGSGRFTADRFLNLPFFYDEQFPALEGRVAHLMDLQRADVNGDGFDDLVGVNQESYQNWNLVIYRADGQGGYSIDRDSVRYLGTAAQRLKYKTSLTMADFDGDGQIDFGYNGFGSAYQDLVNKSVFLKQNGQLVERHLQEVDPYSKWLFSKIIPYGCPYECDN